MEPIHVPGPPKKAFNKNRRISDLIRAQVNHLKHVESQLPVHQRLAVAPHAITTEADAATYIASMTRLFQSKAATALKPATPFPAKPVAPIRRAASTPISLAAGAAPKKSKAKKTTPKKATAARKAKAPAKPKSKK
jgi:hypothetical protein